MPEACISTHPRYTANAQPESPPMHKNPLAALLTAIIFVPALLYSRGEKPVEQPASIGLPIAFGAIQPRLSPDGGTVAFNYQGEIWTGPRSGGTMTLLAPS